MTEESTKHSQEGLAVAASESQIVSDPFQGQQAVKRKKSWLYPLLSFCLAFLLVYSSVTVFGVFQDRARMKKEVELAKERTSKRDPSNKYISEQSSVKVDWTLEQVEKIKFGDVNGKGITADDIVKEHGPASRLDIRGSLLELTWEDEDAKSEVEATFEKFGQTYQLSSLTLTSLKTEFSSSADSYRDRNDRMSQEFYDKLKVGDSETGVGGVSYKEILKTYGDPSPFSVSSGSLYYSNNIEMSMGFDTSDREDNYYLTFKRQSDGSFLLSEKRKS